MQVAIVGGNQDSTAKICEVQNPCGMKLSDCRIGIGQKELFE